MRLLENLDYKKLIGFGLTAAFIAHTNTSIVNITDNYYSNEYKRYDYINFSKENNFKNELSGLLNFIEIKFETKIKEFWVPTKNLLDKVCLFISFEEQEKLEEKYSDLELVLYESLKDVLEKSDYFEMVVLL